MKNPSISGMPSVSIHLRYELFFSAIGCVEILGSIFSVSFFVNYVVSLNGGLALLSHERLEIPGD